MIRKLHKSALLALLMCCLADSGVIAQPKASIVYTDVADQYPAYQPVTIHVVIKAGSAIILPNAATITCTNGSNSPFVFTHPDTLLPQQSDTVIITGVWFERGSNLFSMVLTEDGITGWEFDLDFGNFWKVIEGVGYSDLPDVEDFEGTHMWYAMPASVWQHGTPSGVQITSAHSGTQAWVTQTAGNYPPSALDYLYSPMMPYDSVWPIDTLIFSFYHQCVLADTNDKAYVEYSIDSGATWSLLGAAGDPLGVNWYGHPTATGYHAFFNTNPGWQYAAYKLPALLLGSAGVLQFRFVFSSDQSGVSDGWAIDDVSIDLLKPTTDAGIIDVVFKYRLWPPKYFICSWPHQLTNYRYPVTVKIKNYGTDTLTSIPMYFTDYYPVVPTYINETWTGILPPGDTVWYQFSTGLLPVYGLGNYTFSTNLTTDLNTQNNPVVLPIIGSLCGGPPDISVEQMYPSPSNLPVVNIYPNPAHDYLIIDYQMEEKEMNAILRLTSPQGHLVQQYTIDQPIGQQLIDVQSLADGLYYLTLITKRNQVITRKITIAN
jgi:hypothetical protein